MFVEKYSITNMLELLAKYYPEISTEDGKIKYMTSIEEDYNILRYGAGIYVSLDNALLKLTGKDVADYIHRLSTNSVKDLKPFFRENTLFLNEKGRFIDRTTLINFVEFYLLICSKEKQNKLLNWLNKFLITEEIQISNAADDYVKFDIYGPQSESYLTLLLGDELKSLNGKNVLTCSSEGITFYVFSSHPTNNLIGYTILVNSRESSQLLEYMLNNKSVFDVNLVGSEALNIFRIEEGIPISLNEINDEINPYENNLINEVSFNKGCYIGQEVIARLDTYDKVQRKMYGFVIDTKLNESNNNILRNENGDETGFITSITSADFKNKTIGLVLIRKKYFDSESIFFINDGKSQIPLTLFELPFRS